MQYDGEKEEMAKMKIECTECAFSKILNQSPTDASVGDVETHAVETGHKLRALPLLSENSPS